VRGAGLTLLSSLIENLPELHDKRTDHGENQNGLEQLLSSCRTPQSWRRIRLWPFTVEITEDKKIKNDDQWLAGEGSGIMNWMLAGLRRYYAAGAFANPPERVENTNAYRAQQDILKGFIPERCLRTDLHREYTAWCAIFRRDSCPKTSIRHFVSTISRRNKANSGGNLPGSDSKTLGNWQILKNNWSPGM